MREHPALKLDSLLSLREWGQAPLVALLAAAGALMVSRRRRSAA